MELKDFIPEKPVFTLSSTGKTYELRIPNLQDKMELVRLAGGQDQVNSIFKERNWDVISKLIYRLLVDKSDFLASKEKIIDDEGFEKEVVITGPMKFYQAIQTQQESIDVLTAFNAASIAAEPLIQQYVKNEVDAQKKSQLSEPTGGNSAIYSQVSMDTHQTILETLPTES